MCELLYDEERSNILSILIYKKVSINKMYNTYESTVEYNEDFNEYYLTIPNELLDSLGWEEGDVIDWHLNKDGTMLLSRVDEEFYSEENE